MKLRKLRPSALVQMTLALVGLCGTLVLLADLFFGVLADHESQTMRVRQQVAEALAVQVAALLQSEDRKGLQRTLQAVASRTEGVRSLGVRTADGTLVLQAGDHAKHWRPLHEGVSTPERVAVPLNAGSTPWGVFEIAFAADDTGALNRFFGQPLVVTLLFMLTAGSLAFGLYMRRALQHLDPASVIPQRVQGAFDAMAEGVAVLDARGRVLLTNKAFRTLHAEAAKVGPGHTLSALPWLSANLPSDAGAHPWMRAIANNLPSFGDTLEIDSGSVHARQLVINCAPIADPGGQVRGCLATFSDVSQLQRANLALHEAMAALHQSKEALQRQNAELENLARLDPLTGCLNRRAFHAAYDPLFARSRHDGAALSCTMVDIDHFKSINDAHGHAVGDAVIQTVAKRLLAGARPGDLVCRYGGEEFCVVLPGMGRAEVLAYAERIRASIERGGGPGMDDPNASQITVSIGVDSLSGATGTAGALIDRADQALFRAKRAGRNRVVAFGAADRVAPGADGDGARDLATTEVRA
jgi:diguanylate cyclase (GGDEF)-like protein